MTDPSIVSHKPVRMFEESALHHALVSITERIETLLEEEHRLIAEGRMDEHDRLVSRKDHLLLEAVRLAQLVGDAPLLPETQQTLARVKAALKRNAEVIRLHIDAVNDVIALIAEVCREMESDGTYTSESFRLSRQPP